MAEAKTKKAAEKKSPAKKTTKAKPATEGSSPNAEPKTRKFKEFTILTKRSGRFEVLGSNGKNINGMDKAKVLVEAKLVKTGLGKAPPKEETPAPEAPPSA